MATLEAGVDKLFPNRGQIRTLCAEQIYTLRARDLRVQSICGDSVSV